MDYDLFAGHIIEKAKAFGADLAGTASLAALKRSPSHEICGKIAEFDGIGTRAGEARVRGVVKWPENARSAVVIAVAHPSDRPELDWWETTGHSAGNTVGNRLMMAIVSELAAWLEKNHGIRCFKLPYHIERGGMHVKDAAVLAGLGCVGKNNLFIARQYGPRIRLRVMLTDAALPSGGGGMNLTRARTAPCPAARLVPSSPLRRSFTPAWNTE